MTNESDSGLVGPDGEPVNPSGAKPVTFDAALRKLNDMLAKHCEDVAIPRLQRVGIPRYTARCWARRRADAALNLYCRVTAGAGEAKDVTEHHHGSIALSELAKEGGGVQLVTLATELVHLVVARALMRLVDAGAIENPTPAQNHRNLDGKTCTACGVQNPMPNELRWACAACGQANAGPLLAQAIVARDVAGLPPVGGTE